MSDRTRTVTEERWGWWNTKTHIYDLRALVASERVARDCAFDNEIPVRVTPTYEVPRFHQLVAEFCKAFAKRQGEY